MRKIDPGINAPFFCLRDMSYDLLTRTVGAFVIHFDIPWRKPCVIKTNSYHGFDEFRQIVHRRGGHPGTVQVGPDQRPEPYPHARN